MGWDGAAIIVVDPKISSCIPINPFVSSIGIDHGVNITMRRKPLLLKKFCYALRSLLNVSLKRDAWHRHKFF
jgi:hypothetical protein